MRRALLSVGLLLLFLGGQGSALAITWCGQNPPYASASACVAAICNAMNPPRGFVLGSSSGPDENGIYTQSYNCEGTEGPPPQGPVYGNVTSNPPDVCAPTQGHESNGAVPRTAGQTVPPQTLCLVKPGGGGNCRYDLSVAEEGTDLSDGSLVWLGTWVNSGESCTPGEGGGDTVSAGNDSSDYSASSSAYTEKHQEKQSWLDALKARSLSQRAGTESDVGPFGSFWQPPAWIVALFTPGDLECELGIQMEIPLLNNESQIASTSLCEYRNLIDLYGNFAVWLSSVLWAWSIVTAARVRSE